MGREASHSPLSSAEVKNSDVVSGQSVNPWEFICKLLLSETCS
jgi:hypothetical protein